jgi:hypothetical protein
LRGACFACRHKLSFAQQKSDFQADTARTPKLVIPNGVAQSKQQIGNVLTGNPTKQLKQQASSAATTAENDLAGKLEALKKKPVDFDLALENTIRYRPVPLTMIGPGQAKFDNVFSVRGEAQLFGVPLNIDFSTDQSPVTAPGGPGIGLFKFDLSANRLRSLYQSQLARYIQLKNSSFGGLDLAGYTRKALNDELTKRKVDADAPMVKRMLSKYLNTPGKIEELLVLDDAALRLKVTNEVASGQPGMQARNTLNAVKLPQGLAAEQQFLSSFATNQRVASFFKDPSNIKSIEYMNEAQIANKLAQLDHPEPEPAGNPVEVASQFVPVIGGDLCVWFTKIEQQSGVAKQQVFNKLSKKLMIAARQDNKSQFTSALASEQEGLAGRAAAYVATLKQAGMTGQGKVATRIIALSRGDRNRLYQEIDSVAQVMAGVKSALAKKGLDPQKLLQLQGMMNCNSDAGELSKTLLQKQPVGPLQSALYRLEEFKAGAFSNLPAGGVDGKDVFMKGAHFTFNTGLLPITFGYGTMSDLASPKDNLFSGSAYNQSRAITYIGTEVRYARAGPVKVAFISSFNRTSGSSLYAMPAISSNNIAVTVSKLLNLDKWGSAEIDLSKSTTLYSNKYQPGNDVILDRKAGLNNNASADLFETLSFGAKHRMSLKSLNASENIYFSYSGMGYQNPAGNGSGGARTKFGANFKKGFYRNKVSLGLRTDLNSMPISYTSNDRWKTVQLQFDSRYIISRKFTVSGRYTSNSTGKNIDGISSAVYSFSKVQLEGNANYKIGKYQAVSHLTLGNQTVNNSYATAGAANLFMLNYAHSIVIGQNVLSANIFYNRELSSIKLIGNMLNSDVAYQYRLFSKISLSSGLVYLDNGPMARQAGIRQSVQVAAGKNFEFSSFIDLRKNMIRPLYPDLYAACRAELSLIYHIAN